MISSPNWAAFPAIEGSPVADVSKLPRPFDATMIEHLVEMMAKNDLTELDLHEGDNRIRLRRGGPAPMMMAAPMPAVHAVPAPVTAAAVPAPAMPSAPVAAVVAKALHEIKSPMVGTFYAKPGPDKDDYVKLGSAVKADTVVCKLEAMKLFNDLQAECTGTIAEVCIKNGQPVDFGTVLFRVEL
jgi:acetyl-CoA carboxylase biotin carboxyl carrier protein